MRRRAGLVEVYRDRSGVKWRWRRIARNGQKTAGPQQGFTRRWSAERSAKRQNPGWSVVTRLSRGNRHNQDDMLPGF
jgi:aminoglycoside phosphotransferase (APT) family kinase protein